MKNSNQKRLWMTMILLLYIILPLRAQNSPQINVELKDKPLPVALKLIEKEGGKNIIFSYSETENYRVTASIRQRTQAEAIGMVLRGTPFVYKERENYFVIQRGGKETRTAEIRGKVVDEKGEPLPFSNVLLLMPADSTFVNGCVTHTDGSFLMTAEESTSYIIKVSYIGYHTVVQSYSPNTTIRLRPDIRQMDEVLVVASRPLIETSPNGLKANVAGTSLAQMGTATEMMTHLPFVTGSNGGFTVLGSGTPVIYINNRKVRDHTELDRLQAADILSAEIITTPGSEYAANVPAVIRLRTVKQQGQGLSGSFNTVYSLGHSPLSREYMALNYRMGGLDIFVKGHLNQNNSYGRTTNLNHLDGKSVYETTKEDLQINKSQRFSGEVGFNYELNEHHSFGMRYMPETGMGDDNRYSSGETVTTRDGVEVDRVTFDQNIVGHTGWNQAVNTYYVGELGKWTVNFNADYLYKRERSHQEAVNNGMEDVLSDSRISSRLYAAKLVASTGVWKGRFSLGTEETFTNRYDRFTQNGFSADADDQIKQSAYACFIDYSLPLGKWKLNAGMRYEHQQTRYYEDGVWKKEQSPSYNDLIPVLAANWSDKDWNIGFSYRMTKSNPEYTSLTSSINYRSKYEYDQGNPLQEPCKKHRFALSASWKWLYASANFSFIRNMYTDMIMPYNEETHPGVLLFTRVTIPTARSYSINLNASPKVGCWQPQFSASLSLNDPDARAIGVMQDRKQPLFYFELDNSFQLPHGWFFNLRGFVQTAARQAYIVARTEGRMSARISKSFFSDALNVTIAADDILRTGYYHFDIYGINAYMENRIYRDFQRVGVRVSYKFNATKNKYKGEGAGQNEKNRL